MCRTPASPVPDALALRMTASGTHGGRHRLARRQAVRVRARRQRHAAGGDAFAVRGRPQPRSFRRGAVPRRRQHRELCLGRARSRTSPSTWTALAPKGAAEIVGAPRRSSSRRTTQLVGRASIGVSRGPRLRGAARWPFDSRRRRRAWRGPAASTRNSLHGGRRQLRRRRRGRRHGGARRRRGVLAYRERPLQGRLRHAPLRRAGGRRACPPARDGAVRLHGRGAAVGLGRAARADALAMLLERLVARLAQRRAWREGSRRSASTSRAIASTRTCSRIA